MAPTMHGFLAKIFIYLVAAHVFCWMKCAYDARDLLRCADSGARLISSYQMPKQWSRMMILSYQMQDQLI
jgi:hypothetical protein